LLTATLLAGCTGFLGSSKSDETSGLPGLGSGAGNGVGAGAGLGTGGALAGGGTAPLSPEETPNAPAPDLNLPPDANIPCVEGADASAPSRLWRLTRLQLQNTLREFYRGMVPNAGDNPLEGLVLPFGGVSAGDRFSTRSVSYGLDEASFRDLMGASGFVARKLVADLAQQSCVGNADFAGCAASLMTKAGQLAYRRPLSPSELQQYTGVAIAERAQGEAEAMALALQALLMAPEVNFRLEAGAAGLTGSMDPHAIASGLAYGLTDGPPDAALMEAAANGGLSSAADIAAQARRLIGDKGGVKNPDQTASLFPVSPMERFIKEYFRYDYVERVDKSTMLFDWYRSWAMLEDTRRLVSEILITKAEGGLFPAIFGTTMAFVESNTKNNYGLVGDFGNRTQTEVPGRSGIMTQPSWLAGFSQPDHNDAIRRGRFVRESMLCQGLPGLPIGNIPPLDIAQFPVLRDALTQHRADPACAGCHSLMDPIGFAFEEYDHVGRKRTEEAGRPVDASWEIVGASEPGLSGTHQGAAELGTRLAESPLVSRCFVAHSFQYWLGRAPGAGDGCTLESANKAFQDNGGSYPALVASLLSSPSFSQRKTP